VSQGNVELEEHSLESIWKKCFLERAFVAKATRSTALRKKGRIVDGEKMDEVGQKNKEEWN